MIVISWLCVNSLQKDGHSEVVLILKGGVMSTDDDLQVDQWDAVVARAPLLIAPYHRASMHDLSTSHEPLSIFWVLLTVTKCRYPVVRDARLFMFEVCTQLPQHAVS